MLEQHPHRRLKSNADPLIKVHSGVLANNTAIALARLHGEKGTSAARKAQQLVHHLLMHSGAAWFKTHQILGQGGFAKVRAATRQHFHSFLPRSAHPFVHFAPAKHLGATTANVGTLTYSLACGCRSSPSRALMIRPTCSR